MEVKKLTPIKRAIVRALSTANSVSQAARMVGVSAQTAHATFRLPAVQQYLREQLESAGVTHGLLVKRIREGLDATTRRDSFDKEGNLLKGEERPDTAERREHVKLALRLQGLDAPAPEDKESTVTNNTLYQIVIQARESRKLNDK